MIYNFKYKIQLTKVLFQYFLNYKTFDHVQKKILIFDDDTAVLDVLKVIFLEHGYDVAVCETSHNVLERAFDFQPDLILMDYLLPKIGGVEAINRIRKDQQLKNVPVILLSASTNIDNIKNTCGANDFLRKPFNLWDLEGMVSKYLS